VTARRLPVSVTRHA